MPKPDFAFTMEQLAEGLSVCADALHVPEKLHTSLIAAAGAFRASARMKRWRVKPKEEIKWQSFQ